MSAKRFRVVVSTCEPQFIYSVSPPLPLCCLWPQAWHKAGELCKEGTAGVQTHPSLSAKPFWPRGAQRKHILDLAWSCITILLKFRINRLYFNLRDHYLPQERFPISPALIRSHNGFPASAMRLESLCTLWSRFQFKSNWQSNRSCMLNRLGKKKVTAMLL